MLRALAIIKSTRSEQKGHRAMPGDSRSRLQSPSA